MHHPVVLLGVLLSAATVLAVLLRLVKQSAIIAFIAVGVLAGIMREHVPIPEETVEVFTEVGIILLLFMAGLEMDFGSLRKRWRVVLGHGFGQIAANTLLAVLLASLLLGIHGLGQLVFFGLCLTFSSTIIVLGVLKQRRELESYHGQIILGLMVLQDITAVSALAILKSMGGDSAMLPSLVALALKFLALAAVLAILARVVLRPAFRYLARAQELLFLGSLGWALGVAAVCQAVDFSPEIGAFMAGAALSFLPYRLEIQDKVEPMKDFGVILFFLALGYHLEFSRSALGLVVPIAITVAFVLFLTPVLMLAIGFVAKSKSRPAFYIGFIINQISEFSLILAMLCLQAGVFTERTFMLVTLSTVVTMFFSSFGHQFIESLYSLFRRPLEFLDRHSAQAIPELEGLEGHMVILKYNELAEIFMDHYLAAGRTVLLVDLDPAVCDRFASYHEKLIPFYADAFDPDTWEEGGFADAYAVVSCMIDGQQAELAILEWLRERQLETPFVAATDSRREAKELYEAGATFVIQTEDLAAEQIGILLKEFGDRLPALEDKARIYRDKLSRLGRAELVFT